MEETNRTFADEEGDETIIAPRFDDEETVLARRVVPLEEVSDAHAEMPVASSATAARSSTVAPAPLYARLRGAPRRSLVAALVLVSALAGSALGVGGLYLYQRQRNAAAEQQQAETPAPVAQPTTEAEQQNRDANSKAAESTASTPNVPETNAQEENDDNSADSAKDKDSDRDEERPVAERRNSSEDRKSVATPKRGKKGARDEDLEREARRARRDEDQSASDNDDDRREARRVGVITYRPRRVNSRRGPYADTDRLRRIFEGEP